MWHRCHPASGFTAPVPGAAKKLAPPAATVFSGTLMGVANIAMLVKTGAVSATTVMLKVSVSVSSSVSVAV